VLVHRGSPQGRALLKAAKEAGAVEVACSRVTRRGDRVAFVQGEFRGHGRRVTSEAVDVLLEAVGDDLRALAGACSQLSSDTEGVIDAEVARRYYAGHAEVKGFAVADRAVEGRAGEALVQLRWALQTGTDPVLVVSALAGALRSVVKVASAAPGLRGADLARELGMPPWKVDVVRRQSRGWTADGVAEALRAVATADELVKGAGTDPAYALERAVVAVARAHGGR
jgi:DNA polymerase III delta subunit